MEKKLLRFIMNPSMFLTWFLGIALALLNNYLLSTWLIIKILLVILMSVFICTVQKSKMILKGTIIKKKKVFLELLMRYQQYLFILIVLLVVFKPFD